MKTQVAELDLFYLSYDEPNCEEHWADLLNKVPWAKRVHGVKGFDAAHKECARQSETDRFITIDADNIVNEDFFDQDLVMPESDSIYSWNAKNMLNGLCYGNGGVKCWPKEYVLAMRTHEEADDGEGMEFCWKLNYVQMNDVFSEVYQTHTPYQAFRAGFREGVKMSLAEGKRVSAENFRKEIWWQNFQRLQVWCNIGSDVENGLWAIYGARLGCYHAVLDQDFDNNLIADYAWFNDFFAKTSGDVDDLEIALSDIAVKLRSSIPDMMLFEPSTDYSKFFKFTYVPPKRYGAMVTEKQIQDIMESTNKARK